MANIIVKWKSSLIGSACRFDVYLMNTYIGELKCGGTLELDTDIGKHLLIFKQKPIFGKKAETSFEVVVNEKTEEVVLKARFDINGNFVVEYADNKPHVFIADNTSVYYTQHSNGAAVEINKTLSGIQKEVKKTNGCMSGCLTFIIVIFAIWIVFSILIGKAINNDMPTSTKQINADNSLQEQSDSMNNVLYYDDNFKITYIDLKDPKMGVTSYNLLLKVENNSNKTIIVVLSDGYANDEAVFLGSGMPVKVKPSKKATGVFVVGYGNTSITNIDEIETLELKMTLYDENFSKAILTTDNILINVKK